MARIFTTKFKYNFREYDAIITVNESDGKTSFNVRLFDVELLELVPEGYLNYKGSDSFTSNQAESESIQTLKNSIATSIERHLALIA